MNNLLEFVQQHGFRKVIVLSSADAAFTEQPEFAHLLVSYISANSIKSEEDLRWKRLNSEEKIEEFVNSKRTYTYFLHKLCKEKGVEIVQMVKYCSEGENITQAMNSAENLFAFLLLEEKTKMTAPNSEGKKHSWMAPLSWSQLLKGTSPVDVSMYW